VVSLHGIDCSARFARRTDALDSLHMLVIAWLSENRREATGAACGFL